MIPRCFFANPDALKANWNCCHRKSGSAMIRVCSSIGSPCIMVVNARIAFSTLSYGGAS